MRDLGEVGNVAPRVDYDRVRTEQKSGGENSLVSEGWATDWILEKIKHEKKEHGWDGLVSERLAFFSF